MDAFSMAGESILVFIINELDKAASGKGNGNPADVLLTLLDNLGFTDNYIECMIPTAGVIRLPQQMIRTDQCTADVPFCSDRYSGLHTGGKEDYLLQICTSEGIKTYELKGRECIVTDDALDAIVIEFGYTGNP